VARGTQHRKRRPTANARAAAVTAAPKRQKPPQWQDQLFFQRLRTHAKWAYVGLAVAFVLGFVLLGVGSGSTGVSDVLQNAFHFGGGSGTSISKLEKKTTKNPSDATAWRDLASAYEQKQRTQDAVNALQRYSALRPKDQTALQELAGQYANLANTYATDYSNAQAQAAEQATPTSAFAPPSTTPLGRAYNDPKGLKDPIAAAVQSLSSTKQSDAYSKYQEAQKNSETTYQKLASLAPKDATVQIQLGQAAQSAGDTKTAIDAFEQFLKLAPTDPLAPRVKQALKALKASTAASASASSGG
jgi:tetratricopeptide (TPR) repeat protein